MFCISRDGMCVTETNGFYIRETNALTRYYREGEYHFNTKDETMFCIYTKDGCFMDAFETEEEAKEKMREATRAMASGADIFEF